MITLEQIRLLESKITRAIDLIRVLKEENSTLRKGLESAQRRMRELETLVDGFKTDQKEIESVIVRTLHNLDELEESAATPGGIQAATPGGIQAAAKRAEARGGGPGAAPPAPHPLPVMAENPPGVAAAEKDAEPQSPKEELDIF
ncbi:MAG: cell division protein ZapB [Spirochaetia bacterium]|jgi:FtsZ-binding cell division protein ZapB